MKDMEKNHRLREECERLQSNSRIEEEGGAQACWN